MKHICPKCKTEVESVKPLTYCVCGGKYQRNEGYTFNDIVDCVQETIGHSDELEKLKTK